MFRCVVIATRGEHVIYVKTQVRAPKWTLPVGKIDDITRLKMHREADQDALDLLRSLMSMHVTLVGVGIRQSGLLGHPHQQQPPASVGPEMFRRNDEAATQTERRFDLVELDPFSYATSDGITAWLRHLTGIEQQLRLLRGTPGMLTAGTMPEYLFRRTAGIVGLLERLIEDGCTLAIDTGQERLTEHLLDSVHITVTGGGRMPEEVPSVPAHQTPNPKRHKARNTVFDDKPGREAAA